MSYFLMINSKDCANFYEHNAPYDFTIELPRRKMGMCINTNQFQ